MEHASVLKAAAQVYQAERVKDVLVVKFKAMDEAYVEAKRNGQSWFQITPHFDETVQEEVRKRAATFGFKMADVFNGENWWVFQPMEA